jgi:hypothetical protein
MLNSHLLSRDEIDDAAWDAFVEASPQRYLYYYSWYLDAVCPDWSGIVITEKEQWVSVMPLPLQERWGLRYAFQPRLTQFGGPIFKPVEMERHKEHHFLKTVLEKILDCLPQNLSAFDLNLHPDLQYFLPFHWRKCQLQPRLTYWLPLEESFGKMEKSFSSSVSNHVKKALKNGLAVEESQSTDSLLAIALQEKFFDEKEANTFRKVWEQISLRKKGFLLYALSPEGQVCSGAAFIWDGNKMIFYAIAQGSFFKTSGANALLITEGIRLCFDRKGIRYFDFEGSMIEPVENYFRSFNPEAKIFFRIQKYRHPLLLKIYRRLSGK